MKTLEERLAAQINGMALTMAMEPSAVTALGEIKKVMTEALEALQRKPNISVLDTPKWTPEQAVLEAMYGKEAMGKVCVVYSDKHGCWSTIIGGDFSVGDLLVAAEIMKRRALASLEDI